MDSQPRKSGKRPWLAALLGTLATGLGHLYLRRWKRGLGWFAAAVAVSGLVVPPEAARALLSGSGADLTTLAPLLAVGVASVADAYVLARRRRREGHDQVGEGASTATAGPRSAESDPAAPSVEAAAERVSRSGPGSSGAECPECGEELDPEIDFCPWCTARLDDQSGE